MQKSSIVLIGGGVLLAAYLLFGKSGMKQIPPGGTAGGYTNHTGANLWLDFFGNIVDTTGAIVYAASQGNGQYAPNGTVVAHNSNGQPVYSDGIGGYYTDMDNNTDINGYHVSGRSRRVKTGVLGLM